VTKDCLSPYPSPLLLLVFEDLSGCFSLARHKSHRKEKTKRLNFLFLFISFMGLGLNCRFRACKVGTVRLGPCL
jgi:hypothetical protein